jgi:hypothetical protein
VIMYVNFCNWDSHILFRLICSYTIAGLAWWDGMGTFILESLKPSSCLLCGSYIAVLLIPVLITTCRCSLSLYLYLYLSHTHNTIYQPYMCGVWLFLVKVPTGLWSNK